MSKVDLSNYAGREQAYVKHCLLEGYLPEWAYKVGSKWDSLVYVDAFAGPWQTKHPDYADSSFGIAVDALRRCQAGLGESRGRDLHVECILGEQDEDAFAQGLLPPKADLTSLCEHCRASLLNKLRRLSN